MATSPLAMTAQDAPMPAAVHPRAPVRTAPVAAVEQARLPLAAPAVTPRPAVPAPDAAARCASCGQMNQRGLRFCITCGKSLTPSLTPPAPAAAAFQPAQQAAPPAQAAPPLPLAAPAPEAQRVIAPARVVDVGPAPSTKSATRVCARCRGTNDATSQFCKFCGVSLASAEPDRSSAVPTKPAAAAAVVLAPQLPPPPAPADLAATIVRATVVDPDTDPKIASAVPIASVVRVEPGPLPPVSPVAESVRVDPGPVLSSGPMTPPIAEIHYRALSLEKALPSEPVAPETRPGRLVAIARDGGEGPSFPFGDVADLGRTEGHIVVGDDRYVSPRHARLSRKGERVFLRDLGSVNGVYLRIPASAPSSASGENAAANAGLDGRASGTPAGLPAAISAPVTPPLLEVPLGDQDLFLVGQQVIRFELVKDAEEGLGAASEHGTLLFGTPASPRYARLTQRTVEGVGRDVFYIRKAETVLGRESGDIVFTEDPFLSRRHALVRYKRETKSFTLADLGSSNGTFVRIREEVELKDGDQFRIGQQLFRVDLRS